MIGVEEINNLVYSRYMGGVGMEVLAALIGLLALLGIFWQLLGLISPKIAMADSKGQALKRAGLCLLTVIVLVILTHSRNSVPISSRVEDSTSTSSKVEQATISQERNENTAGEMYTDINGRTKQNHANEEARVEKNTKTEVITPTKLEAIKAFNAAHQYYNDSYGFVPDDIARKRMIESKKKIIESFPANWKCGLLVVRFFDSKGDFICDYYPLIETKDGYYYGEYYLKGVEVKEVNYNNIYSGNLSPVSMAEKNPIAIWRSSSLWKEKQNKIWEDNYWINHGQYNDPDLLGAEWLPLN